MRIETKVLMPELWMFGKKLMDAQTEKRIVLSERERATLRSAARILERVREAANDFGDGQELDIRDDDDWRAVAVGEVSTWEIAEAEFIRPASEVYPALGRRAR